MNFTQSAAILCGQCAVLLGWRPGEFWAATPAELECVLSALAPKTQAPPTRQDIEKLMEQYPDG
jgi:uncharacterized phage protein (TIGR02216 family)